MSDSDFRLALAYATPAEKETALAEEQRRLGPGCNDGESLKETVERYRRSPDPWAVKPPRRQL